MQEENPDAVNEAILGFLARIQARDRPDKSAGRHLP
jgi:hypothetical protein